MAGPDPGHLSAAVPERRRRPAVALTIATPVLAVVALVLALLPGASFGAGLPALAALVLAVVLVVLGAGRLLPALSAGLAVVAIVVAVVVSVAKLGSAFSGFVDRLPQADDRPSAAAPTPGPTSSDDPFAPGPDGTTAALDPGEHDVVYEVLGGGSARISYTAVIGGSIATSQEGSVTVPHRRTQHVTVQAGGGSARLSMVVSRTDGADRPLGCRITIDGTVVSERPAGSATAVPVCAVEAS